MLSVPFFSHFRPSPSAHSSRKSPRGDPATKSVPFFSPFFGQARARPRRRVRLGACPELQTLRC